MLKYNNNLYLLNGVLMRDYIISELLKDIYGPRQGAYEELKDSPFDEYITGVIVPKDFKSPNDPDSEPIDSSTGDDESNEVVTENFQDTELQPQVAPKTFGLTFYSRTNEFDICITWGRYTYNTDKKVWKRSPHVYRDKISHSWHDAGKSVDIGDGVKLYINLKKDSTGNYLIDVFVANEISLPKDKKNFKVSMYSIYQPSIRINIANFEKNVLNIRDYDADNEIEFLYKERKTIASGHRCSAIWKSVEYSENIRENYDPWPEGKIFKECSPFQNPDIRTEFIPIYAEPAPEFQIKDLNDIDPADISEMWEPDEIEKAFLPLLNKYREWHKEQICMNQNNTSDDSKIGEKIVDKQESFIIRLQKGIQYIKEDENARLAFCFANRAIYQENQWLGKDFKWRPFQLAFIITNLESIANPYSKFKDVVDLLWAPTGSGKTEAYLALAAYAICLRRLKFGIDGYGTSIITRYTLRLLTVQQFRRTITLITSCEYLRIQKNDNKYGWKPAKYKENNNKKEFLYGSMRFSIGMWVGSGISPNHTDDAIKVLTETNNDEITGNPAQVLRCPACNTTLAFPKISFELDNLTKKSNLYIVFNNKVEKSKLEDLLSKYKNLIDYKNFNFTYLVTAKCDISWENKLWNELENNFGRNLLSLNFRYPGYFGTGTAPGKKNNQPYNFEIYCPNPKCVLNNVDYSEGIPFSEGREIDDGYYVKKNTLNGMPIPVYTVDDQIYNSCPTIIIGTVDKIARLAFEPRAASMIGNVNTFNKYYGYYRFGLEPCGRTLQAIKNFSVDVKQFRPPDLIIQDELHLIDGPLGSMYGLYETAFEALINNAGGAVKYIASTATIKNTTRQTKNIFGKEVYQFPPNGLNVKDNYFMNYNGNAIWDEDKRGKIYLGISSTGYSQIIFLKIILSRLLKSENDKKSDKNSKYYWTNVVYFNAIKELAMGMSVYKQDVRERLIEISPHDRRDNKLEEYTELSSRINSLKIPQIIDQLELEGKTNDVMDQRDALFTTSMFGTGIDIPHLSSMIVYGQPKTTSQYIQATGRIGRTHGGLVITLLNPSKSRDTAHYEYFIPYHERIHQYVEPVSVSPFSTGCMDTALGPVMVSFLRNKSKTKVNWLLNKGTVINDNNASTDTDYFTNFIVQRSGNNEIKERVKNGIKKWKSIADCNKEILLFNENKPKYKKDWKPNNVVLGDFEHKRDNKQIVYENAPQSLRDVEETINFEVD